MSEKKQAEMAQLSAGQQRKLEKKKAIAKEKRNKVVANVCWYVFVGILAAVVVAGIGLFIYRQCTKVVMNTNYSAGLDNNGLVKDVKASDIVELGKYKGIEVPYSEVKLSDSELATKVDDAFKSVVADHASMSTAYEGAVADGDKIKLDYTGSVDGVEFSGGKATDADLTIGSKQMIDGFESQIIGHKIGEEFTIDVTFPEDYGKDTDTQAKKDLNGKKAQFKIKVKSIQVVTIDGKEVRPVLNDDFVKAFLSDKAASAEAYKDTIRVDAERTNIEEYVMNKVFETSKATSYPKKYIKALKSQAKQDDYNVFASYAQYLGWTKFDDYLNTAYKQNEWQYDVAVTATAEKKADKLLAVQAIAEKENLTADAEKYKEYLVSLGEDATQVEQYKAAYGTPYFMQQHLSLLVTKFVADAAVIAPEK